MSLGAQCGCNEVASAKFHCLWNCAETFIGFISLIFPLDFAWLLPRIFPFFGLLLEFFFAISLKFIWIFIVISCLCPWTIGSPGATPGVPVHVRRNGNEKDETRKTNK